MLNMFKKLFLAILCALVGVAPAMGMEKDDIFNPDQKWSKDAQTLFGATYNQDLFANQSAQSSPSSVNPRKKRRGTNEKKAQQKNKGRRKKGANSKPSVDSDAARSFFNRSLATIDNVQPQADQAMTLEEINTKIKDLDDQLDEHAKYSNHVRNDSKIASNDKIDLLESTNKLYEETAKMRAALQKKQSALSNRSAISSQKVQRTKNDREEKESIQTTLSNFMRQRREGIAGEKQHSSDEPSTAQNEFANLAQPRSNFNQIKTMLERTLQMKTPQQAGINSQPEVVQPRNIPPAPPAPSVNIPPVHNQPAKKSLWTRAGEWINERKAARQQRRAARGAQAQQQAVQPVQNNAPAQPLPAQQQLQPAAPAVANKPFTQRLAESRDSFQDKQAVKGVAEIQSKSKKAKTPFKTLNKVINSVKDGYNNLRAENAHADCARNTLKKLDAAQKTGATAQQKTDAIASAKSYLTATSKSSDASKAVLTKRVKGEESKQAKNVRKVVDAFKALDEQAYNDFLKEDGIKAGLDRVEIYTDKNIFETLTNPRRTWLYAVTVPGLIVGARLLLNLIQAPAASEAA